MKLMKLAKLKIQINKMQEEKLSSQAQGCNQWKNE